MRRHNQHHVPWHTGVVIEGLKIGRTIGFPTLNIHDPETLKGYAQGVYAAKVNVDGSIHDGALFLGPRHVMNEEHTVLEIYILDFDKELYGKTVLFAPLAFIRPVKKLNSVAALKKQLEADVKQIRTLLRRES